MHQYQKPMLNSPVELHSDAAEKFAKHVIARLEASHEARRALNYLLFQAVQPDGESIEPDKRLTALDGLLNRKTFGAAG